MTFLARNRSLLYLPPVFNTSIKLPLCGYSRNKEFYRASAFTLAVFCYLFFPFCSRCHLLQRKQPHRPFSSHSAIFQELCLALLLPSCAKAYLLLLPLIPRNITSKANATRNFHAKCLALNYWIIFCEVFGLTFYPLSLSIFSFVMAAPCRPAYAVRCKVASV